MKIEQGIAKNIWGYLQYMEGKLQYLNNPDYPHIREEIDWYMNKIKDNATYLYNLNKDNK